MRIDNAQAVGTNQTHAILPDLFHQKPLCFGAFASGLLESRRNDAYPLDAFVVALVNGVKNGLAGNDDNGKVYAVRHFRQRRINRIAFDNAALWVNGINVPLEAVLTKPFHEIRSDAVRLCGRTDDGD